MQIEPTTITKTIYQRSETTPTPPSEPVTLDAFTRYIREISGEHSGWCNEPCEICTEGTLYQCTVEIETDQAMNTITPEQWSDVTEAEED